MGTRISIEEFLSLPPSDDPEPEYVRGEVIQRFTPDLVHDWLRYREAVVQGKAHFTGDGYDEAMAVATRISAEEFLSLPTPDGPEPEYVRGEVIERSVPTIVHSQVQIRLGILLTLTCGETRLLACSEVRCKVTPEAFRTLDIAVFVGPLQERVVATIPPYLALEILSPDDSLVRLTDKLEEYKRWGVPHIWMADPWHKHVFEYLDGVLMPRPALVLPEFSVEILPSDIFQDV